MSRYGVRRDVAERLIVVGLQFGCYLDQIRQGTYASAPQEPESRETWRRELLELQ